MKNKKSMFFAFAALASANAYSASSATRAVKIVGGVTSAQGEFPYIISLQVASRFGGSSHICGGSLIKSSWVLTAAHCVRGTSVSSFIVKTGMYRLTDVKGSFHVSKAIVHPSNNSRTNDYDFALLKLNGSSVYSPVMLNSDEISIPSNQNVAPIVTVAGWGTTSENGNLASILQKVNIPLVTKAACLVGYPGAITDRMICAGNLSGGKDSCQGDSGGPLVIKENNGEVRLVGVVSWGNGCARKNQPGVYGKVNSVVSWIADVVAKN